jgi:nucleotide-binding universal stress UspA family protein
MKRFRTILHPTDFSPGSAAAFQYACDLARDSDGRVIVVHALSVVAPFAAEGVMLSINFDELRTLAQMELDTVKSADPAVRVDRIIREGPTTAVILQAAADYGADVIVMGTHGRTGFRRFILGSVTEEVLRKAPCPVLTVKTPDGHVALPEPAKAAMVGAGI